MPTIRYVKSPILTQKSDCLLVFAQANKSGGKSGKARAVLSPAAQQADSDPAVGLNGQIAALLRAGDFSGKSGEQAWLLPVGGCHKRVLLAGLGEDDEDAREGLEKAFAAAAKRKPAAVAVAAAHLSPALAAHAVLALRAAVYEFKMGPLTPTPKAGVFARVAFAAPAGMDARRQALATATGEGISLTKHLAEQPGNVCTPAFLGDCAKLLAKNTTLSAKVYDEKGIAKMKMGALLAVAKGSEDPPRFIVLRHEGGGKSPPVALVGKGVTFDTGGISLKPAAGMDEMKFDMSGAATVFGVMLACARAKLPLNIVGVIPACENVPDGEAVKPGDVVTAGNGKTIEVLNTDAEGRLILADALIYADRLKPAAVIDIATLTGACVIALGNHVSGLLGRDDALLQALLDAGNATGDICWRLPMGKKYQRQLKTNYADVANIGGRPAGTITAACFLSRFVECKKWAHLDIAGTAWNTGKRATGRPVGLLMEYLAVRAAGGGKKAGK